MAEKKCPATVRVYFDNVNSESYQTFLAYCDRLEYKYARRLLQMLIRSADAATKIGE